MQLKKHLSVLGLDAQHLAEKVGVSHQAAYGWMSGKSKPRPKHLLAISNVVKVPVHQLYDEFYGKKR